MTRIRIQFFGLIVFLSSLASSAVAQNFSYSTPLIAGRINEIGEVLVERNGDSLDVTYIITDSTWKITKTYLHITDNANGFPTLPSGVPNIQNYTLKTNHASADSFKYDNIDVTGQPYVYVSANANVTQESTCKIDTSIINANVPSGQVFMLLTLANNPAYFEMLIYDYSGDPIYQDYFYGNCVDLENPIYEGVYYFPKLVSSYSNNQQLLDCLVDKPENLDLVNFVINQDYKTKYGADGPDVQAAIWTLIDNSIPQNGDFGLFFDQNIVDKIVADASAKGEFYVPQCDEYFAILVDQGCTDALNSNQTPSISVQQSILWLPVSNYPNSYNYSYGECANAWGIGSKFSQTGWGQYFEAK
ncbi:MAG: hypothetical protein ACPGLV_05905 [Bacteroidia bacterium]